ncbi:THO complex subunit 4 protein [Dioscorea alata]|uniref:THO complex subunit 4 protein n=1 Tax=Dioscorea alata TaxID=55571 RepID=A0ACB7U6N2_DIOAL|nr:THO complex subunit 4 protein [Dioscorea alata]
MSLDNNIRGRNARGRDISRGRGRGMFPGRGGTFNRPGGPLRQGPLRVNAQPSPYKIAKSFSRAKDAIWRHDLFTDTMAAAGLGGIETGTKLYISNLDYGVSNEDIKELFSEVGNLMRCVVHYDRNGRPTGSAEVVYVRRSDAMAAFKRYNNVQLDGKPMKIEEIGPNIGLPVTARVKVVGASNGRGRRTVVMTPKVGQGSSRPFPRMSGWSRGAYRGRGRGNGSWRGRGGRGFGRGLERKQPVEKSAAQLDKELDSYHADAMNTS